MGVKELRNDLGSLEGRDFMLVITSSVTASGESNGLRSAWVPQIYSVHLGGGGGVQNEIYMYECNSHYVSCSGSLPSINVY